MRLLITGSDDITEYRLLAILMDWSRLPDEATRVVSGSNAGVDRLAREWAEQRRLDVHSSSLKAFTKHHGRKEGERRYYGDLASMSDAAVVLFSGDSRRGWDLIDIMRGAGKPVDVGRVIDGKVQTVLV